MTFLDWSSDTHVVPVTHMWFQIHLRHWVKKKSLVPSSFCCECFFSKQQKSKPHFQLNDLSGIFHSVLLQRVPVPPVSKCQVAEWSLKNLEIGNMIFLSRQSQTSVSLLVYTILFSTNPVVIEARLNLWTQRKQCLHHMEAVTFLLEIFVEFCI